VSTGVTAGGDAPKREALITGAADADAPKREALIAGAADADGLAPMGPTGLAAKIDVPAAGGASKGE
jgi:hypothetical protein